MNKTRLTFLGLVVAGFLISLATALASGRREAWDAPAFFTLAIPAMVLVTGVAGWITPGHSVAWGLAVGLGVWIANTFAAGELANLWPIGLLFSLLLGVLLGLGARAGSALRRRRSTVHPDS